MSERLKPIPIPFKLLTEPVERPDGVVFDFVRYQDQAHITMREKRGDKYTRFCNIGKEELTRFGQGDLGIMIAYIGQQEYQGKW